MDESAPLTIVTKFSMDEGGGKIKGVNSKANRI